MKKLSQNLKHGTLQLEIDTPEDLWYLSFVIDKGDLVKSRTIRKIKLESEAERKTILVKRACTLQIRVERTELTADSLRVSGKITEGPDEISRGSYHTITLEQKSTLRITKPTWPQYQLDKIDEACASEPPKILIVVHDREEAVIALMKKHGYSLLVHMKGSTAKKRMEQKTEKNFYKELTKKIQDYILRHKIKTVLVASPAFFKEDLLKLFPADLKKKTVLATCSSVGNNAIDEVLQRDEVRHAVAQERAAAELKIVDKLLKEISLDGPACYGLRDTKTAAEAGAIKTLLVTDKKVRMMKEKETFHKLHKIMILVDKNKAKVSILSSDLASGKKLDGLTGIAAILRYKLAF